MSSHLPRPSPPRRALDNDRVSNLDSEVKSPLDADAMTGVNGSLVEGFDGIVCDLDGVVYRGQAAVPHAVDSLLSALSAGVLVVYATNNASRARRYSALSLGK